MNLPENIPVENAAVIRKINSKVMELTFEEIEIINEILIFHDCEFSAQAERISELLSVSHYSILELL